MATSKTRDFFLWTDDQVGLLLSETQEHEAAMAAKNVDRESSQCKYGNTLHPYRKQCPSSGEAMAMGKDFPNKKTSSHKVCGPNYNLLV